MDTSILKSYLQQAFDVNHWQEILRFISGNKNRLTLHLEPKDKSNELSYSKSRAIFSNMIEIGRLKTSDNADLPIYDIELKDDKVQIEHNRVGVNELLKKIMLKEGLKGILVTFHYPKNSRSEWRFSFISKSGASDFFAEVAAKETNPRKYTYIFGTQEEHRTAIDRLFALQQSNLTINDFFDAFNVEPVSKEFFNKYKQFYLDFIDSILDNSEFVQLFEKDRAGEEITSDNSKLKNEIERDIRNFVKRLMGRIIFLYFLQKKHWLGATDKNYKDGDTNFLENLFIGKYGEIDQSNYYRDWLCKLFFEALNSPLRNNDAFILPNKKTCWIPYLNGGLFDENQEPKEHRNIQFPKYLFETLFEFFNSYNFTIYENSPEDHTIAVDPEMLGHIFENLLEDNKDKGAFYTPKEIVHYMCQESLIEYLYTHIQEISREQIEALIKNAVYDGIDSNTLKRIESYIDKVKICDPAIGSGAFPMGLLQEIFNLKALIHYELGYNVWSPATIKQNIIQNSIYGVDIEIGAVDIARLRFWLSLVVDEELPKPLPNLDYKIMQGDSLLESFEGINLADILDIDIPMVSQTEIDFGSEYKKEITLFDSATKEDIRKLLDKFFSPEQWEKKHNEKVDKQKIKREINNIVEGKIHTKIFFEKKRLKSTVKEFEDKYNLKTADDFDKLRKNSPEVKKYLTNKTELEKLHKIEEQLISFQTKEERPYFLWHLFFNDVFEQGGFDIVIGNPPYLKEGKISKTLFVQYKNSPYYQGKMDLWYMFACCGIDFMKNNGHLCFIATNNWATSSGASKLRNKVISDTQIKQLVDFGSFMLFDSASIQTMVMLFSKNNSIDNYIFDYRRLVGNAMLENALDLLKKESNIKTTYLSPIIVREKYKNAFLTFNSDESLFEKISSNALFLTEKDLAQGIVFPQDFLNKKNQKVLGNNFIVNESVFGLSDSKKNELTLSIKELELIKPYYTTEQIHRYYTNPRNTLWLIYTDSKFKNPNNMCNYPKLKTHLDRFASIITSDNKPYGLHRAREERFFQGEKITALRKSAGKPSFSYSNFDCYVSATFYVIKTDKVDLKYLIGVLNSTLIAFWLKNKGKMQGDNYQLDKEPLMQVPIFKATVDQQQPIISLVDYIIYLKNKELKQLFTHTSNERIASHIEDVLNMMVYELYFGEHMKDAELDVFQFVNLKSMEDAKDEMERIEIIKEFYLWFQKPENPIRQRMLLIDTRSKSILSVINKSV